MSKINDGGPAFPTLGNVSHNSDWITEDGMTLRQHYAGLALQGVLAGYWGNASMGGLDPSMIANEAVQQADALIAELAKGEQP